MFSKYKTLIFDCDGVILDSNKLKTQGFYKAVMSDGSTYADALVNFHLRNGGISRYKKFSHYLSSINKKSNLSLDFLLSKYKAHVFCGLLSCDVSLGFEEFIISVEKSHNMVISGGDQAELKVVFGKRSISHFFDGGIFGSPLDKEEIIRTQISNGNLIFPAVFFGDSKYDYEVASKFGIDFIYLSDLSEITNKESWIIENNLDHFANFRDMLK
jgi:phosphoglycolate phosphatase-like HAD superfamily hydrolase